MKTDTITFPGGGRAQILQVSRQAQPGEIIEALRIPQPRAVVCLNGGTAELDQELATRLELLLVDGLARVAAVESLTIVTGATDAGIFSLLGHGVEKWRLRTSLIGVAPDALVTWPGRGTGETQLEPHHTHFVLVEGENWGDESETMYALVRELSRECPSVAVFAGGGKITVHEMQANVAQQRSMIFVAGSGRKTDAVLAARRGENSADDSIQQIAAMGRIEPFDIHAEPDGLAGLIRKLLFNPQSEDF